MTDINWVRMCQEAGRETAKEVMSIYRTSRRAVELSIGYGGDTTLEADQVAEDIVIKHLRKLDVGIKLISEERGEMFIGEKPEYTVVVDPIDGSFNYSVGLDYFGISIAVLDKKTNVITGYVMNIPNGTEYYATKEGAFKNEKRIKPSRKRVPKNVILECSKNAREHDIRFMSKMFLQMQHSRAPGAVALDICNVADGTFDCLLYAGATRYMDIAAAVYILEKAGGLVSDFDGDLSIRKGTMLTARNLLAAANDEMYKSIVGERIAHKKLLKNRGGISHVEVRH
ncbi:MAG: inositol monophosphatase family protein [archaeon]